jgi:hypothetical protein
MFAYRTEATLLSGRQFTRDGRLCQVFSGDLIEGEVCGLIYRDANAAGDPDAYVFVSFDDVKRFSLVKSGQN